MSRWYRFYDDAINDPKILRLSDAMFRAWVTLLCLASKNDGVLPKTSDIALVLRMKITKVAEWLSMLTAAGLLDNDEGTFRPHNWNSRQFKSDVTDPTAASRQKAYRDRNKDRNADRNAAVTVKRPDTDTDTDTEPEKKETRAAALVDDGWPADYRDQFWAKYPNKVGKPKALAKLDSCRKRGVAWIAISSGLARYIREKPVDRAWLNPETFLNQERWTDQPAHVSTGPARIGGAKGFETLFQSEGKPDDTAARSEYDLDLAADRPH